MFFHERLKGLREDSDLDQETLANILNITRAALSNYETGYREPSLGTLVRIADYFNVSLDYLLCRTHEYKPFK